MPKRKIPVWLDVIGTILLFAGFFFCMWLAFALPDLLQLY